MCISSVSLLLIIFCQLLHSSFWENPGTGLIADLFIHYQNFFRMERMKDIPVFLPSYLLWSRFLLLPLCPHQPPVLKIHQLLKSETGVLLYWCSEHQPAFHFKGMLTARWSHCSALTLGFGQQGEICTESSKVCGNVLKVDWKWKVEMLCPQVSRKTAGSPWCSPELFQLNENDWQVGCSETEQFSSAAACREASCGIDF